jgi:hypothetical protein
MTEMDITSGRRRSYSALALLLCGLSAANLSEGAPPRSGDLAGSCWGLGLLEKISLSCAVTRMKVVRLLISFNDLAPGQIVCYTFFRREGIATRTYRHKYKKSEFHPGSVEQCL